MLHPFSHRIGSRRKRLSNFQSTQALLGKVMLFFPQSCETRKMKSLPAHTLPLPRGCWEVRMVKKWWLLAPSHHQEEPVCGWGQCKVPGGMDKAIMSQGDIIKLPHPVIPIAYLPIPGIFRSGKKFPFVLNPVWSGFLSLAIKSPDYYTVSLDSRRK